MAMLWGPEGLRPYIRVIRIGIHDADNNDSGCREVGAWATGLGGGRVGDVPTHQEGLGLGVLDSESGEVVWGRFSELGSYPKPRNLRAGGRPPQQNWACD